MLLRLRRGKTEQETDPTKETNSQRWGRIEVELRKVQPELAEVTQKEQKGFVCYVEAVFLLYGWHPALLHGRIMTHRSNETFELRLLGAI